MSTDAPLTPQIVADVLRELVSTDMTVALAAAKRFESVENSAALRALFVDAVQTAGFDKQQFADDLVVALRRSQDEERAWMQRDIERFEHVLDDAMEEDPASESAFSDEGKQRIRDYLQDGDVDEEQHGEDLNALSCFLTLAFEWIGNEVGPSVDRLRETLRDPQQAYIAYGALEKMGPKGAGLADEIIEQLTTNCGDSRLHDAAVAVFRGNPEIIRKMIDRFWTLPAPHPYPGMIPGVICALGPQCADADPDLPAKLLEGTYARDDHKIEGCIVALGGVTRGTDVAVERLIELTRHPRDIVQGAAISALGCVQFCPEIVVPHLASLLDTFEEYDPDMSVYGYQSRITDALREYGPAAAAALPRLLAHLQAPPDHRDDDLELDESIVNLLKELGPAAHDALPLLEEWEQRLRTACAQDAIECIRDAIRSI